MTAEEYRAERERWGAIERDILEHFRNMPEEQLFAELRAAGVPCIRLRWWRRPGRWARRMWEAWRKPAG